MVNDLTNWVNKFADIKTFNDRCSHLISRIKQIYLSEKVLVFYHDSRYMRYTLERYDGFWRSQLGNFAFNQQRFIRCRNTYTGNCTRHSAIPIAEWEFFSDYLKETLLKTGVDTILPFWSGRNCTGGVIFDSGENIQEASITSFEEIVKDIAYLLEISFVKTLYDRQKWENNILLEVGKKISSFGEIQDVLDHMLDSLREILPYDAAGIFLIAEENSAKIEHKAIRGYPSNMAEKVDLKVGKGIVGWSIKNRTEAIVSDVRKDSRYISAREATLSEMVVPIIFKNNLMGAFNLESDKQHFFRYRDLDLLRAFAAQTAVTLNNSIMLYKSLEVKQFEKELEIAKGIQRTLLPQQVPDISGYDFAASNISSRQIGGDLYDFVEFSSNEVGVAIGDVAGKGIPGAMLMAALSASFREQVRKTRSTEQVLRYVNEALFDQTETDKFATFFYGILDPGSGEFTFTNAGHNPPILMRSTGKSENLSKGGSVIGFIKDLTFSHSSVKLESGDVIFMYTDGLSEAEDKNSIMFGDARIQASLAKYSHRSADKIIENLVNEVKKFTGIDHQEDDLTMVVIKKL